MTLWAKMDHWIAALENLFFHLILFSFKILKLNTNDLDDLS